MGLLKVYIVFGLLMTISALLLALAVKKAAAAPASSIADRRRVAVQQWQAEVEARRAGQPKPPASLRVRVSLTSLLLLPMVQIALFTAGYGWTAVLIALGATMGLCVAAAIITGFAKRSRPPEAPLPPFPKMLDAKTGVVIVLFVVGAFALPPKGDILFIRGFIIDLAGLAIASQAGALLERMLAGTRG